MTFIDLTIQKCYLTADKNQIQCEEIGLQNFREKTEAEMQDRQNYCADHDIDLDDDSTYEALAKMDTDIQNQITVDDTRLATIQSELEGLESAIKNNIKSECKLFSV